MADPNEKNDDIAIMEAQDGSAMVELPENMLLDDMEGDQIGDLQARNQPEGGQDEDSDDPSDNEELRQAKRNRRRAKKDLIRKTNQEKDARLTQLQRENEEMKRDIAQLKRNTKAEQLTRIDKSIEDAQVRLEYAKMKLAEASQNQDGQSVVEATMLLQNVQEEFRNLSQLRNQADQELSQSRQQNQPQEQNKRVQKLASQWMRRNSWYNPQSNDPDSRVAKKMDELLSTQGWDPEDEDYWEELDARLQKELPHRYNDSNDDESRGVRRPRNVVGSSGREASAAYGGTNRSQFILSPDRVKAMKEVGAWDNPERKARMIKQFIAYDRANGVRN
jgi:hypothetical protein